MQLRYVKTIREAVEGESDLPGKIADLAWSPNGQRLVAATAERQIVVFDGNGVQRDRFALKPAAKGGAREFVVRGVVFAPDSARLAVAQTDGVVYVYQLGANWDDRKSVCNKFAAGKSGAPVSALCWPAKRPDEVVFGTGDGRVRVGLLRTNKTANLYESEAGVVALCAGPDGHSLASAHADGAIYRYTFPDAARPASKAATARLTFAAYALAWGAAGAMIAAGTDSGAVLFLSASGGDVLARFKLDEQREMTAAAFSPSGKVAVVGSWDGFALFAYEDRWTRVGTTLVPGLGAVTALAFRPDGSRLTTGSMTGAIDLYDACLKRFLIRNTFQVTFTSPSSMVVGGLVADARSVAVSSGLGLEIQTVDIVQDRFVIARTAASVIIADLVTDKTSEVRYGSAVKPRVMFPSPDLALLYSAGELSAIELGHDDVIGSCRTEFMSPALVSVSASRSIAYLLDRQTVVVLDLRTGATQSSLAHDTDLDWLELNASGRLLLFRDARHALHLYSVAGQRRTLLAPFVSYAQWVPGTDVVVAQTRTSLLVWYSIAQVDQSVVLALPPRSTDVAQIERGRGRTRVVFDDGAALDLDETQISFVAALESGQYEPVVLALEQLGDDAANESMWSRLSQLALDDGNLYVAERCFVALGDAARAAFLRDTIETGDHHQSVVRARLALLCGNFRQAEALLLSSGRVDDAINMYVQVQKWDSAIAIAESRGHDHLQSLRERHLAALLASGQEVRAGELRERDGDYVGAVRLYVRGGAGPRAADLIKTQGLAHDNALVEDVVQSLLARGQYEPAGDFLRQLAQPDRALQAYRDGCAYARAVDLCRQTMPARVTQIEQEWGDYLVGLGQHDAASNHFIEGGAYTKAIAAAVDARQYGKAGQILANMEAGTARPFYRRIAQTLADSGQVRDAEPYYVAGGMAADAVDRYLAEGALDDAERIAAAHLSRPETVTLFATHAQRLMAQGMLAPAERLLLVIDQVDRAIDMYRQAGNADAVVRLVARFRKEQIAETYATMAKEALRDGKLGDAEAYLMKIGKWREVVDMYRQRGSWNDAMRVARSADEPGAYEIVACTYARTLSADAAVKFLKEKGLVDRAVDIAMERADFQEAFRIADKAGARPKLFEVHLQYAMALEDEGQFDQAEAEFLAAEKPREAIDMFLHQHEWARAAQIAQQHDPGALPDIYTAQAAFAEQNRDLAAAESLYLNAGRPELAIQMYRNAKAWNDALRCARTFRPNLVAEIQMQSSASASIEARAAQMVAAGQTSAAIDLLLSVTASPTTSPDTLEKTWIDAVKLAIQHVPGRVRDIVVVVAQRLVSIGRHTNAADLLAGADLVRDAVDVLINAGEFTAASALAAKRAPELVEAVERAEHGGASPIDALAAQGQWPRVYEMARAKGQLDKYQQLHLETLLKSNAVRDAIAAVLEHGLPTSAEGVAIVRQLARAAIADAMTPAGRSGADLLKRMLSAPGAQQNADLGRLLFVAHLISVQNMAEAAGLKRIAAKIAISLIRYPTDVPVDKALYKAGRACQSVDWGNMAFVFFNRFVDVCDLIDDPEHGEIDNSDFLETDIPALSKGALPKTLSYSDEAREEIREMVLEIAMSNTTSQSLTQRQCETCSARTYVAGLTCHQCRKTAPACCVTGYPVLETSKVECGVCHRLANRDDWNRFVTKLKICAWCATPSTPFY